MGEILTPPEAQPWTYERVLAHYKGLPINLRFEAMNDLGRYMEARDNPDGRQNPEDQQLFRSMENLSGLSNEELSKVVEELEADL